MAFQLQGNAGVVAEVEANTRAFRLVGRPIDYGSLGIYAFGQASGIMAAGLAGAAPILAFRNGGANDCLIRRIQFSAGNTATAFAAGVATFNAFVARSWTVSDTGGTAATLTGDNQNLRTTMAATSITEIRYSTTLTLTAGTRTKDAQPFASYTGPVPATAGTPFIPASSPPIFDCRAGEYPLCIETNEGFVIEATVPATGTWTWSGHIVWEEVATYA